MRVVYEYCLHETWMMERPQSTWDIRLFLYLGGKSPILALWKKKIMLSKNVGCNLQHSLQVCLDFCFVFFQVLEYRMNSHAIMRTLTNLSFWFCSKWAIDKISVVYSKIGKEDWFLINIEKHLLVSSSYEVLQYSDS